MRPGAVHVPMTQLAGRLDDLPDGNPVYIICRSGGRSARAAAYLNRQGWDTVNVGGRHGQLGRRAADGGRRRCHARGHLRPRWTG